MILELIKTIFCQFLRAQFTKDYCLKAIYSVIFPLKGETKMQLSGICTFLILCPHTSTHTWSGQRTITYSLGSRTGKIWTDFAALIACAPQLISEVVKSYFPWHRWAARRCKGHYRMEKSNLRFLSTHENYKNEVDIVLRLDHFPSPVQRYNYIFL